MISFVFYKGHSGSCVECVTENVNKLGRLYLDFSRVIKLKLFFNEQELFYLTTRSTNKT